MLLGTWGEGRVLEVVSWFDSWSPWAVSRLQPPQYHSHMGPRTKNKAEHENVKGEDTTKGVEE